MKRDLKQFRDAARHLGIDDEDEFDGFSDYVHDLKDRGVRGSGSDGDFTWNELLELAQEYLELEGQ